MHSPVFVGRGRRPAEVPARTGDPSLPARQQRVVGRDAREFEDCARRGEEQVAAGEAPRVLERQCELDRQSSPSGAKRTPRSSRMSPSRLSAAATGPPSASPRPASPAAGRAEGVAGPAASGPSDGGDAQAGGRRARAAGRRLTGRRRIGGALHAELGDLLPRAHQRVGEDEQQVALAAHAERGVDGFLLVRDDRDRVVRHAGRAQRRGLDARHLVRRPVAQAVVAPADVVIEAAGDGIRDGDEVLVAPVARAREHDDATTLDLEPLRRGPRASRPRGRCGRSRRSP